MPGEGRRKPFRQQGDRLLLALCLLSSLYGLLLIFSATRYDPSLRGLVGKQMAALFLGIGGFFLASQVDLDAVLLRSWKWILLGNVGLLLLLLPFGKDDGTGNQSWITLPGGSFHFQPGEVVKLTFALLLALQFCVLREKEEKPAGVLFWTAGHTLLLCGLLYGVSGDMGMVLLYLCLYLGMAWAAGVPSVWLGLLVLSGVGAGAALWQKVPGYVRMRFLVVWNHQLDPLGKGFQQNRSLLAIGSGQVTGQGYLRGTQTQSGVASALPARHTDFIFSAAGEELGLLGCLLLLLLLGALVIRCVVLARRAESPLHFLVAMGFGGVLGAQVLLNVGMCLFLAPVVGVTLPFFSYGGSSLVTNYAAMGILSGFCRRRGLDV